MNAPLFAGVEAGGTKFVCGVGGGPQEIIRRCIVPTTTPEETLGAVTAFFEQCAVELGPMAAAGVASFGPLDLDPGSPTYGSITDTPKANWSGFGLRAEISRALRCPVAIDTDVTGSGLAEAALGAGRGLSSLAYVTVGTGIGGALIQDGKPMHRVNHPEMGHITLRRHQRDGDFTGVCSFHGDCLEGMASGPSVMARYGKRLSDLPPDSPIWAILADYLAQLCSAIQLIGAPQRIVMGGGVMSNSALFGLIRDEFRRRNNGYMRGAGDADAVARFIVPPELGDDAGLIGALLMAQAAA